MSDLNNSALFFDACRRGDAAQVTRLYEHDQSLINIMDTRGFTPLILAVYNNQPQVVTYLIEKGAAVDAQDFSGNTALMGASFKGYTDVVQQLIAAGADVNLVNGNGATALTFAATFGQLQIAEILLHQGADVTVRDVRGKSPIDHAIIQENEAMVALLDNHYRQLFPQKENDK